MIGNDCPWISVDTRKRMMDRGGQGPGSSPSCEASNEIVKGR